MRQNYFRSEWKSDSSVPEIQSGTAIFKCGSQETSFKMSTFIEFMDLSELMHKIADEAINKVVTNLEERIVKEIMKEIK